MERMGDPSLFPQQGSLVYGGLMRGTRATESPPSLWLPSLTFPPIMVACFPPPSPQQACTTELGVPVAWLEGRRDRT